ncbi:hypothetical protein FNV43_RR11436 [Rhamnella rubrinervis]|uniref:RBR-type E3 ubiquitin transferase n=1 Tax=Rhamnella rubrinervis TaxID=2594499 RepID=A0A8K0MHQ7_9ROSA|nr:hypothetical protein FNV43_RR11436 [Rhamnella rubrinervis]
MEFWDDQTGAGEGSAKEEGTVDNAESCYTIMNEADIRQRQEDDIERVSAALSMSKASAIVLLRHFNWNSSKLFDMWFDDEDGVRNITGLLRTPLVQYSPGCPVTCGICLETYTYDGADEINTMTVTWASCGHPYCRSCWARYISKSIHNDGPGCLLLECPHPSCSAAVGETCYRKGKIKWCPAPGCNYAIDFVDFAGGCRGNFDVYCRCSYSFCWNCNEGAHRPADCDAAVKWMLKNKDESQNYNWILVNTKPCPDCKRPIEKNLGCNHMTCSRPCRYEFCWICMEKWSNKSTHICISQQEEANKINNEAEKSKEMMKACLAGYTRHYERWAAHQKLRQRAIKELRVVEAGHLDKLSSVYDQPKPVLRFIVEAWQQIIECRRVMQWTCVYGYYLSEDELAKSQFLEYLQGEAEARLERLHECTEKEIEKFMDGDGTVADFIEYKTKLTELTYVIGNYFKNLVRALEDGLSEVGPYWAYWHCEHCSYANRRTTTRCQMCFRYTVTVKF